MTGRLSGKVAIVAGAGSIGPGWGNGKATATIFAREGAKVVCADINRDAAEETAGIIRNEGGEAFAMQADVTKAEQVAELVAHALGRYGRIDILDNNVGIAEVGSVVDLPEETTAGLANYVGAIAVNRREGLVGLTSPKGGRAVILDAASGRVLREEAVADAAGIAAAARDFAVSSYGGRFAESRADVAFDQHIQRLGRPA